MIIVAMILDAQFFRKSVLKRAIFYSIAMLIILSVIFGIAKFFYSENLSWGAFFSFIFLGFIVSVLGGVANYFHLLSAHKRIRRLKEKYSKLAESPEKQKLMEKLDKLEREYSIEGNINHQS